jgi:DNA-3-methyladenine glycosylase II
VAIRATPKALRTLRADPVMAALVAEHHEAVKRDIAGERPGDAYGALLRSIVGQQLSTKAARTIYGRMTEIFGGHAPTPRQLLAIEPEKIRAAGLSNAKVAYLRDLAVHVEEGTLALERLPDLDDEEVAAQLTAIKGLGRWTADMFLMFHLGRPDILPVGDQGIRNAARIQYRLRKLPDAKRLEKLARPWRPYRTLACLYLWSSLDNRPG